MFDYNTNPSGQNLYGINKGDAQVFDNNQLENIALRKQDEQIADKKAKEAKLTGLMTDIGKLDKGNIRPNDLADFGTEQQGIYNDVKKAFLQAKGGSLPIDQQVDFESRIGKLQQQALISGARYNAVKDLSKTALLNPNDYDDPEEIKRMQEDLYDSKNSFLKGGLQNDLPTLTKRFDISKAVKDQLLPDLLRQSKGGEISNPEGSFQVTTQRDELTPEQSNQATFNWAKTHPEVLARANNEINRNPELKKQYNQDSNPDHLAQYVADKYAPAAFNQSKNDRRPLPKETEFEYKKRMGLLDGKDEKVKYEGDYTENPDGKTAVYDFRPVNKGENPSTQIDDPNNPKAKLTINPNRLNIDKNDLKKSTLDATVVLTPKQVSANDTYKEENSDPNVAGYKLPYPERVVLDYPEAASIMKTNVGLPNIASLLHPDTRNQVPGHINNKYTDYKSESTIKKYTPAQEENIKTVLSNSKNKGYTREQVIQALKY